MAPAREPRRFASARRAATGDPAPPIGRPIHPAGRHWELGESINTECSVWFACRARLGAPADLTYRSCSDPPYWSLWNDMTKSYDDLVAALLDSGEGGHAGNAVLGCLRQSRGRMPDGVGLGSWRWAGAALLAAAQAETPSAAPLLGAAAVGLRHEVWGAETL